MVSWLAGEKSVVFVDYSIRSTAEVQSLLYAASDIQYIDEDIFSKLSDKCSTVARLIQGFKRYLKSIP